MFPAPRVSIELTDYITIEEVLVAVRELSFKGGSAKTGDALAFVAHGVFSPAVSRGDVAKVRPPSPPMAICNWLNQDLRI